MHHRLREIAFAFAFAFVLSSLSKVLVRLARRLKCGEALTREQTLTSSFRLNSTTL